MALISHTSKVMLKILQARLQQYMNCEIPDVQAEFRKGRGNRNQIANICWIIEKAREFKKKKSTSVLLTTPNPLIVWIITNFGKFFKKREYQTTLSAFWEICIQVKKKQLEPDMEWRTGSRLWKEYVNAIYWNPAYLNYIQRTSCEMPGWMKHKLESRLPEEISIISDIQMTPTLWQESKKICSSPLLDESERGEWKSWP